MPLIGPFFFILGLIMASAIETPRSSQGLNSSQYSLTTEMPSTNTTMHITSISNIANDMNINSPNITSPNITSPNINSPNITSPNITSPNINSPNITSPNITSPNITSPNINSPNINSPNITTAPSTPAPSTTEQKGGETTKGGKINPIGPAKTTPDKNKLKDKKPPAKTKTGGDTIGIVILILILIVALGFVVACCVVRKRGRRYSVDFTSRQDEANIPLSIVDHELPADTVSQNGLKSFENTETKAKEPQEPEGQEEQKPEADKSVVDPGAESAAATPSPHGSEDKPKEDVAEPSPTPAPVQPSAEEKTDDEGTVSNKTSVESLKETNDNNSNNADFRQATELDLSNIFRDVPLDSPV
ncbi:rho GTPase-activating protein gacF [Hippoglossus hippoglossus]|uniref:rho GTPase-activating protein gacF n=1 Tax=Hippoglossus hippoglossus TaxID=8267 RepID=UPI00148E3C29|nr:rho GTPase-activating protein gacF [Hippoglossus hippoglossus]